MCWSHSGISSNALSPPKQGRQMTPDTICWETVLNKFQWSEWRLHSAPPCLPQSWHGHERKASSPYPMLLSYHTACLTVLDELPGNVCPRLGTDSQLGIVSCRIVKNLCKTNKQTYNHGPASFQHLFQWVRWREKWNPDKISGDTQLGGLANTTEVGGSIQGDRMEYWGETSKTQLHGGKCTVLRAQF